MRPVSNVMVRPSGSWMFWVIGVGAFMSSLLLIDLRRPDKIELKMAIQYELPSQCCVCLLQLFAKRQLFYDGTVAQDVFVLKVVQ